jgi:uncharacterized protein YyaL (SSP411 family)
MIRTITLISILCAFLASHAQVNIQAKVKDYEFLGQLVMYNYSTKSYKLYVRSENPYEDKVVRIHIGDNATEAYESLENIYELYQRPGMQFEIGRYSVIVDNMMNLELLLKGSELSGNDTLKNIALTHSRTTMKNHYREDYSSYHLVDYDPETGAVLGKQTVQGYADDSAWARGQAWGLYGYTMVYRFTKEQDILDHAVAIAEYIIPRLPEDYVPFWDFDAPDIPNDVRDASAGALIASALIELSAYVDAEKAARYLSVAENMLRELASDEYLAQEGEQYGFILRHSTGHKPKNSEVDVPLTYADYYFLEALLRWQANK